MSIRTRRNSKQNHQRFIQGAQLILFSILLPIMPQPAISQDDPNQVFLSAAGKFSCSGDGDVTSCVPPYGSSKTPFKRLNARSSRIPVDAVKNIFGPFDGKLYGFTSVEFHQFLTGDELPGV